MHRKNQVLAITPVGLIATEPGPNHPWQMSNQRLADAGEALEDHACWPKLG
jgi:hypothetical protein